MYLDAFSRGRRPPAEPVDQDSRGQSSNDEDAQQRLDSVTDECDDKGRTETWGGDGDSELSDVDAATLMSELAAEDEADETGDDLQRQVDAAIETLEGLQDELG